MKQAKVSEAVHHPREAKPAVICFCMTSISQNQLVGFSDPSIGHQKQWFWAYYTIKFWCHYMSSDDYNDVNDSYGNLDDADDEHEILFCAMRNICFNIDFFPNFKESKQIYTWLWDRKLWLWAERKFTASRNNKDVKKSPLIGSSCERCWLLSASVIFIREWIYAGHL